MPTSDATVQDVILREPVRFVDIKPLNVTLKQE